MTSEDCEQFRKLATKERDIVRASDGGWVGVFSALAMCLDHIGDANKMDAAQRETIQQLREAVEMIESSRMILLNTFCQWQIGYGEGKHALREQPHLRATIQQLTEQVNAWRTQYEEERGIAAERAEQIEELEAELESHTWEISPAMAEAKIEQQAERIKALEETNRIAALAVAEREAELARLESDLYWAASQHASILGHRTPEDEARTRAIMAQGPPTKEER